MRPHSADLRHRIVTLYEQGEGSIRQLAKRFQVSQDSVHLLAQRLATRTGTQVSGSK